VSGRIRVVLVEDQYFFRLALRTTIEAQGNMEIVGETGRGDEAVALCREYRPDVAIVDLRLPGLSGFEVVSGVHLEVPGTAVLVVSNYEGSEDVHRALSAGALGYLTKDAGAEELISAIKSVCGGLRFVSKAAGAMLAARSQSEELTDREFDVLRELVKGRSNKEIAAGLGISENTVRIHMGRILDKIGATDRTQAALMAIQRGLVHVD
jgi:DNA-binding NarL/FixJ family response regulator